MAKFQSGIFVYSTDSLTSWLTAIKYQHHRWQLIRSSCRNYNSFPFSRIRSSELEFITGFGLTLAKNTDFTYCTGSAYLSGSSDINPRSIMRLSKITRAAPICEVCCRQFQFANFIFIWTLFIGLFRPTWFFFMFVGFILKQSTLSYP